MRQLAADARLGTPSDLRRRLLSATSTISMRPAEARELDFWGFKYVNPAGWRRLFHIYRPKN
jgi:hypothetical protein